MEEDSLEDIWENGKSNKNASSAQERHSLIQRNSSSDQSNRKSMPVTMAEIPPKLIGGIDYSDFAARAEQINEKEFIIRHKVD